MKKPNSRWFLWENLRWMVASLLLAFGLWIIAVFQTDPVERANFSRQITVEYLVDNNMLLTSGQLNEGVIVTLRAPRSVWDALRADQIEVVADLRGKTAGQQRIELVAELAEGLRGEVVDISPRWLDVTLEQVVSKRIPIRPLVIEEPPTGFDYPSPTCSLTEVTAQGPASVMEKAVAVARLSLKDYRNPVTLTVSLQTANDLGRSVTGVTLETSQVECNIEISPIAGVTELSIVPTIEGFPPAGYIYEGFDFSPRTVIVAGSPLAIRDMNGIVQTEPIDLSQATSNFERTVSISLPTGVQLRSETQTVTVSVKIGTIQGSRQYSDIPIQIEGLSPTQSATLVTPTVTVFVVGPQPLLQNLTARDVRVVINVENDEAGTYQKTATATLVTTATTNNQIQLTVQPPEVGVTITDLDPTPSSPPDTLPAD